MMLDAFNWTYALIILVFAGPSNIIFAYALASIFPPKDARVYWGVQAAMIVLIVATKQYWSTEVAVVVGTAILVAPPLICLKGPSLAKIVTTVVALIVQLSAEIPAAFLWIVVVGQPVMSNEAIVAHLLEFLLVVVPFHILCLSALFWLFAKACRTLIVRTGQEKGSGSVLGERSERLKVFVAFPCVQFVLILSAMYVAFVSIGDDESYMVALLLLFIAFISSDILLFIQMQRYADKQLSDLRAASLEARADEYLAKAAHMQGQLRDAARLRHDLRNHVHVVEGLCERGDMAEAQAYLRDMLNLM